MYVWLDDKDLHGRLIAHLTGKLGYLTKLKLISLNKNWATEAGMTRVV